MKKILLLNLQIILTGIIMGVSMALSFHSPWWLALCIIPIFFGWIPIVALINMDDYLEKVFRIVFIEFLLSISSLMLGPLYLDEKSFLGIIGITALSFMTIITMALSFKLRNKWIIKDYYENKTGCES